MSSDDTKGGSLEWLAAHAASDNDGQGRLTGSKIIQQLMGVIELLACRLFLHLYSIISSPTHKFPPTPPFPKNMAAVLCRLNLISSHAAQPPGEKIQNRQCQRQDVR